MGSEKGVSDMAPIDDLNHRDFLYVTIEMKLSWSLNVFVAECYTNQNGLLWQ